jgi:hypothetical protein
MATKSLTEVLSGLYQLHLGAQRASRRAVESANDLAGVIPFRRPADAPTVIPATEQVVVTYQSHRSVPFIAVKIYGPTAEEVQTEIDRAMRSAERDGATAFFQGPRRAAGGWGAIGEVTR